MHLAIQRIHIEAWAKTGRPRGEDARVQEVVHEYAVTLAEVLAKYLAPIAQPTGSAGWDEVNRQHFGDIAFWTKQILMSWEAEANAAAAGGKLRLSYEAAEKEEQDSAMPKELHIKFLAASKASDQERKCGAAILFLPQSMVGALAEATADYTKARLQEDTKGDKTTLHVVFPTSACIAFSAAVPETKGVVVKKNTPDVLGATQDGIKQLLQKCSYVYEYMHKYFTQASEVIELEIEAALPVAKGKPNTTGCQEQLATDHFARDDYRRQKTASAATVKAAAEWLGHTTIKDEGFKISGQAFVDLKQSDLNMEVWAKAKKKCTPPANLKRDKKRHYEH